MQLRVPSSAESSHAAVEVSRPFSELQRVMSCLATEIGPEMVFQSFHGFPSHFCMFLCGFPRFFHHNPIISLTFPFRPPRVPLSSPRGDLASSAAAADSPGGYWTRASAWLAVQRLRGRAALFGAFLAPPGDGDEVPWSGRLVAEEPLPRWDPEVTWGVGTGVKGLVLSFLKNYVQMCVFS